MRYESNYYDNITYVYGNGQIYILLSILGTILTTLNKHMLSLRKAAMAAGISKSKLQKDAKAGFVTYTLNEKKNYQFDEAELNRAYPKTYKTPEQRTALNGHAEPSAKTTNGHAGTLPAPSQQSLKIALLEQQLEHVESTLETVRIERRNERERLEQEVDRLWESLRAAEAERSETTTKLLEHHTKEAGRKRDLFRWLKKAS